MRFTEYRLLPRMLKPRNPLALRRLACLCAAITLLRAPLAAQQPQSPPPASQSAQPAPQAANAPAAPALPTAIVPNSGGEKSAPPATDAAKPKPNPPIADQSAMLLKLANDLMAEIAKSNKDTLSVSVIRKADEIEHFAHDVRVKASTDVGAK